MHGHASKGWWSQLTTEQKLVFAVASLAWLFDCLDQQLFNLARSPAMTSLLKSGQDPRFYGGLSTSVFMLGWAVGGIVFGPLGDRHGRARMLGITVLLYAVATGLSALSTSFTDFAIYRFITGLGIGGVFGLAVALVADTLPGEARPRALGALQSLAAFGNAAAGMIGIGIALSHPGENYWKWLFLIGALPALLTGVIQTRLKEPARWVEARARAGSKAGSYADLFGHPTWRRHALLGMLLSCAGVVGLWGIGVFSTDMVGDIIAQDAVARGLAKEAVASQKQLWMSINLLAFNVGAYFGMVAFTHAAIRWGRRPAFAAFFSGSLVVTVFVFQSLSGTRDILWMAPLLGFFHLSVFAGFSMYLPELFPTRLRSTGTSFCYNVGRCLAATGPFSLGLLAKHLAVQSGGDVQAKIAAFRNASSVMCVIFLLGLAVLPFLPETRGKPLPED